MKITPLMFNYSRRLETLPLSGVQLASWNPADRTTPDNVKDLMASIQTEGQLDPIHVVKFPDGHLEAVDGNRRTTALKLLKKTLVSAWLYDGGTTTTEALEVMNRLYEELNKPKRTLKAAQMTQAHLHGGPAFNTQVKNCVAYANKIFDGEIPTVVKDVLNPNALSNARSTAKYCMPGQPHKGREFEGLVRVTLLWQSRRKTQQECIAYRRQERSAARLRNAIENNEPHVPGMGFDLQVP